MNKLKPLETEAQEQNIDIRSANLPTNISGLYYSNGTEKLIALNAALETQAEQACVLAEELGHHYTSCGNLLTDNEIDNTIIQQQELRAKRWATKRLVSIKNILNAYEHGCQSIHDFSEYLDVTEDFFRKSLKTYSEMYGPYKQRGKYTVYFDPPVILKLFE